MLNDYKDVSFCVEEKKKWVFKFLGYVITD